MKKSTKNNKNTIEASKLDAGKNDGLRKTENRIQAEFHQWLWNTYPNTRGCCYAIPNGGFRGDREAMQLKASGVVPGIPDYHINIRGRDYNSLYIEFKTPEANMNTEHVNQQKRVHKCLEYAQHRVVICTEAEAAKAYLIDHLRSSPQSSFYLAGNQ